MTNVIDQSGILAIATRLQRLADRIRKDGVEIYKANGVDFEPKWFPVIYTLHMKTLLSVVEIAEEIGYTHPSTISLLKELEEKKLIKSARDKADSRRRMVQLTEKGKKLVSSIQPVWTIIIAATADLIDTQNNLMQAIIEVEEQFARKSFLERAKDYMATHHEA